MYSITNCMIWYYCCYFHSHTLDEVFPCSSASYSNTPTKLLRTASFPFEDAVKNIDPVNLIFPALVNLPIPCPVHVAISCPSLVIITPLTFAVYCSVRSRNRPVCTYLSSF